MSKYRNANVNKEYISSRINSLCIITLWCFAWYLELKSEVKLHYNMAFYIKH